MEVQKVLRMKEGVGPDSYANNSRHQRNVTTRAKPVIEESIKEVYHSLKPKCFMMADMGCSSGPNALLVVTQTINVIDNVCQSLNLKVPEFGIFLNDLPGNDFNTLFNFLPDFYKWVEQEKGSDFGPCFVSGTPRSFHGRVFPECFLHFVYSGYALHWLSQEPEGLVNDQGEVLNNGNIWVSSTSLPEVHKVYYTQFKKDFTKFLSSRAKEIIPGGSMVLTFPIDIEGRNTQSSSEVLAATLQDMVLEGMIEQEKLDKFSIPVYLASGDEVRQLIEAQGSFNVNKLETFTFDWSVLALQDLDDRAKFFASSLRAVCESFLANAFGEAIIDDLFCKLTMRVRENIANGQSYSNTTILVSVTKKT